MHDVNTIIAYKFILFIIVLGYIFQNLQVFQMMFTDSRKGVLDALKLTGVIFVIVGLVSLLFL